MFVNTRSEKRLVRSRGEAYNTISWLDEHEPYGLNSLEGRIHERRSESGPVHRFREHRPWRERRQLQSVRNQAGAGAIGGEGQGHGEAGLRGLEPLHGIQ